MRKEIYYNMRFIRAELIKLGDILKHDITDDTDNLAAQDLLDEIDERIEILIEIARKN